jgi:CubicO group peptidase (beta-lactamase class C family)
MKTFYVAAALALSAVHAQVTVEEVWAKVTPLEANMDANKLYTAIENAGIPKLNGVPIDNLPEKVTGSETYCVSVHRDGKLVAERYWRKNGAVGDSGPGVDTDEFTPLIIWSASKAVTHTLVGIAEKDGLLNTEDKASKYISEWNTLRHPSQDVLVDMLMRHDSGRYYDLITDFVTSQFQPSQTEFAINMPKTPLCPLRNCAQQHEPGSLYQYNQMGIQNLHRVLQRATGEEDINKYATVELFNKLSMESRAYFMERSVITPLIPEIPNPDPTLPPIQIPSENTDPLMYGGGHMSCKDLARFGQLWLNRGQWNGTEVFTDEFYEKALRRAPEGRAGRSYHWGGGPNHKAEGLGKQFVTFNPEKNLIITRIGGMLGTFFDVGELVNGVMDSLLDGPGSYTADSLEPSPVEEEQFVQLLLNKEIQL